MRLRVALVLSALSLGAGAGSVACFDVLHSTNGIRDACELDAAACADGGSTSFCAWSPDEARTHAAHACAWLGACEGALGHDAFGDCMFDALLAYDCAANPSHPVRGATHDLWDCLWQAQSCGAVERCVFPGGAPTCGSSGDFTSCGSVAGVAANAAVRIECVDGGVALGESCALRGQTCASEGTTGTCAGAAADAGGLACSTSECVGTHLHWCPDGGGDLGLDCASNGAARCAGFPGGGSVQWLACMPEGDSGCAPDASDSCSGGVATSCRAGVVETLDCASLLQSPGACVPGTASPFDWTAACVVDPPSCNLDSCSGSTLTACGRGATFQVDCSQQGLGACQMVTTAAAGTHATCTRP